MREKHHTKTWITEDRINQTGDKIRNVKSQNLASQKEWKKGQKVPKTQKQKVKEETTKKHRAQGACNTKITKNKPECGPKAD